MTSPALTHYADQARIAELEAEVARLKPDAERYRFTREVGMAWRGCYSKTWREGEWAYGCFADAEVDAALAASKEKP